MILFKIKSEDARQPQCPEENEKAIVDAVKHLGMVITLRLKVEWMIYIQ